MGRINGANLKKTLYYLKRNGLQGTFYAVRERLDKSLQPDYCWTPPAEEELTQQRQTALRENFDVTFSIVVPTYRTPEEYLRQLVASVCGQSYEKWELILADATEDDSVRKTLENILMEFSMENFTENSTENSGANSRKERIRYCRLEKNEGISDNTNAGIALAENDYVGLLDHDDILAENALYEMAAAIEQSKKSGVTLQMLYSDEDKCNGDRSCYYEPNFKEKFNLDLLLTNNYICHFMVMKRELIQELKLRREYDGAQDFDLVLRAAGRLSHREECIVHIPKVLYHWRCHTSSTAENPRSKLYAYEAGRRAVQDFVNQRHWNAEVRNTAHLGFYEIRYGESPLKVREELGAVGGRVVEKGKIVGGRMTENGKVYYKDLPRKYSGYLHRAVLAQEAEALDIRNMEVAEALRKCVEEIMGVPYVTLQNSEVFDASTLPRDTDYAALSLQVSGALRRRGYKLLYLPARIPDVSQLPADVQARRGK